MFMDIIGWFCDIFGPYNPPIVCLTQHTHFVYLVSSSRSHALTLTLPPSSPHHSTPPPHPLTPLSLLRTTDGC